MHFADEVVGILAATFSAFMAAKAKQSADKGVATDAIKSVVSQRLPKMFGIGRNDEQIFESIRQLVPHKKRHLVDLVIGEMRDYEAEIFRLTVAGMPCGNETDVKPVKNPQKGQPTTTKEAQSLEFIAGKDLRAKYLEDIADEVSETSGELGEQVAAALVVADMRTRRVITRSAFAQKVNDTWEKATKWVKMNILDFFGVDSFDEITDDVFAKRLNSRLEELVGRYPEILSLKPVCENIGSRVVVRETLEVRVPSVLSIMARDVRGVFREISQRIRRW